ncbi:NAD-P-binding protein [Artomyces pyxidatus]|uniref:NAD-P-binding protein n=1 Tax=Artomyces pyxidatus TaxID=48021 RepID=A0ACB8SIC4_9AGAM|nr:NAD-P-binding protein [Artomyces pyxidatus]
MLTYKVFAVAGAGNIGVFIVEELLKLQAVGKIDALVVLTRSTSSPTIARLALLSPAPIFEEVDYTNPTSITQALSKHHVDAVISTLGHAGGALDAQPGLAEAARKAGVRLFVPSEFGNPTEHLTAGMLGQKGTFQGRLREMGLPSAMFYTGPFADLIFEGYLEWDVKQGKVEAGADGNVHVSYTARRDVARYLAYVLTTLPAKEIEWRTFRIEGDRKTFNQIFADYEERTGRKLNPKYRSKEELEQTLKENPKHFSSMLQYSWISHGGTVGEPDQLDNKLYADWNPIKVVDILTEI